MIAGFSVAGRRRTRTTNQRPAPLAAVGTVALAVALLATGCAPDDGAVTSAPEPTGISPTADEPDATGAPGPDEAPVDEGGSCVIGEWTIPEGQLQQFYDNASDAADITVLGDVTLSFSEETFEYLPDFTIELAVAGQQAEGDVGGSVSGSYTSEEGVITTSNERNDMTINMDVGGQPIEGGAMTDSFLAKSPVNSAPYECGPDGLVLMFQSAEPNERIAMRLEDAG